MSKMGGEGGGAPTVSHTQGGPSTGRRMWTGGRGPRRCTIQPDLVEDRPVMSSSSSTGLAGEVLYYFLGDNIIIATIYPTYELSNGPH
jgi:hypothetical protein